MCAAYFVDGKPQSSCEIVLTENEADDDGRLVLHQVHRRAKQAGAEQDARQLLEWLGQLGGGAGPVAVASASAGSLAAASASVAGLILD